MSQQVQTTGEVLDETDYICFQSLQPALLTSLQAVIDAGQTHEQIMNRIRNFEIKASPALLDNVEGALRHMFRMDERTHKNLEELLSEVNL